MTIRDIAAAAGLSLRQLALRTGIPYRTVQDWAADKRQPPPYLLPLLAYRLGVTEDKIREETDQ